MAFQSTALASVAAKEKEGREELTQAYTALLDSFYASIAHVTNACCAITRTDGCDSAIRNEIARRAVLAWLAARAHLRGLDPANAASPENIACARVALFEAREGLSSALTSIIAEHPEPLIRFLLESLLLSRPGGRVCQAQASPWLA